MLSFAGQDLAFKLEFLIGLMILKFPGGMQMSSPTNWAWLAYMVGAAEALSAFMRIQPE